MDRNQIIANEIDKMEGLTDKARKMIEGTEIRLFEELFAGCSADDLNTMAEEHIITANEAENLVATNDEWNQKFVKWLAENDKQPHEWDADDLGEFFRENGFETMD